FEGISSVENLAEWINLSIGIEEAAAADAIRFSSSAPLLCRNKNGFIDNTCRRSNSDEVLVNSLSQNGALIAEYFNKLSTLWKQFDALVQLPRCTCHVAEEFKKHNQLMKLMQLLMGLDDSYMKLRINILAREPLPDAKEAYFFISNEESRRVVVPLDEIEIDENLRFIEEPLEIVERDVKKLKRRRIPLVKVRWNSRQGAEYTWEREDQFRMKYPHLFSEPVPSSNVAT
ncbi:hypothetical protein Tco_0917882, partial [Tanacetum coccineum]